MKLIPLSRGLFAKVSDEDYSYLSAHKWHAKATKNGFYATGRLGGEQVLMHRYILKIRAPRIKVDHWNHDGLDNRRDNLRVATHQQNIWNARKNKNGLTSKYRGVYRNSRDKRYYATISFSGHRKFLGSFVAPEEAARAYDAAAKKNFGEFASLNFPETVNQNQ